MDLTDTIIPKSDQLNSEDLIAGPRTFTITDVRGGSDEQPVNIHLAENPGRPFRPSKTVRRILVAAWGKDGDAYIGRRLTLYRDPAVKWAGQEIGGIRVSHLSHIAKPMKLALAVTKGKRENYTVQPLDSAPVAEQPTRPAPAKQPTADELIGLAKSALAEDALNAIARKAVTALAGDDLDAVKAVVTARREELKAATA
jgi:hypothetical protein